LNKKKPKLFFIDFYTDWCGWCKKMDVTTYLDRQVVDYLNAYFYPVRFDAEGRDTIIYRDTVYLNTRPGPRQPHNLAIKLLSGNLTYPTIGFLDKEQKIITAVPGYRTAYELLPILVYLNEEISKNAIDFSSFEKYFHQSYPDDGRPYTMVKSLVKWLTLDEALALNEKNPKKIYLDFYVNWKVSCTMMMLSTYSDPKVAEYLNEKYYPVRIDATTRDTLNFGAPYINPGVAPSYHQLPYAMLNGEMNFPVSLYFDENNKLLNVLHSYLTPESIEPVLLYFGENIYKTVAWKDYFSKFETKFFKKTEPAKSN
jgi:thioredoxin-related protein